MNETNFTVIIPSKKIDKNLQKCVSSIRLYYKSVNIILLLDKTDQNNYFDNNVKIIETGSVNVSKKRNIGFKNCNSTYVVLIDSDAYPVHPWLNNVEKIFENNQLIGACGGPNLSQDYFDKKQTFLSSIKKSLFVTINYKLIKTISNKRTVIDFLPSCNLIIKREIFDNCQFMNSNLFVHEDVALNESIKKKKFKIFYDPDIYVIHKDRSFYSFLMQRFTYGSDVIKLLLLCPCKSSYCLFFSTIPFFIILIYFSSLLLAKHFFIFSNLFYLVQNILIVFLLLIFIESVRIFINFKQNILKVYLFLFLSLIFPGIGLILSLFLNLKTRRKIRIQ